MTTERCECCDLRAYSCGKAAEDRERREEADLRAKLGTAGWIEAIYHGACSQCGKHFKPGTLILFTGIVEGHGWLAECCPDGER